MSKNKQSNTTEDPLSFKRDTRSIREGRIEAYGLVQVSKANANPLILIGMMPKPESHMTPLEKMERLTTGVSKEDLEELKLRTELDYDKLAKLLSVTRATLINKKGAEKFNVTLSERIIGLADIYSYGYEVFEDEEKFNKWMFSPNKALGGNTPYEVSNNQFGREEVKNIIGRIEYGVYS
ncbi:MAG: hypothetical protein JWR61_401 [Ferruginibacter sp.]|uniref:type II RES/Xre toxin-antitoxin system antitoxin n=1 Tax=Ferruginibacter sp. TaxID=1940288 RepID=UPI00265AD9F6|nr:antitoxin Xre/MbcA/ParS toxin-binding domain-containing protein [Ferruginibacter sp.]MDB5275446.1 hypothetical protein [Ferruginibacter sp.]